MGPWSMDTLMREISIYLLRLYMFQVDFRLLNIPIKNVDDPGLHDMEIPTVN